MNLLAPDQAAINARIADARRAIERADQAQNTADCRQALLDCWGATNKAIQAVGVGESNARRPALQAIGEAA